MAQIYFTDIHFRDSFRGMGTHFVYFTINKKLPLCIKVYQNADRVIDVKEVIHLENEFTENKTCPFCKKEIVFKEKCEYFKLEMTQEMFDKVINDPSIRIKAMFKGLLN